MKEFMDKLSSYNLFNYLFPGIVFIMVLKETTPYSLLQENIFVGVFIYYFAGMVISRFGSLIIEPLLKKSTFLKFVEYPEFLLASKNDAKLELLSEVNNMYRTLFSTFFLLVLFNLYGIIESHFLFLKETRIYIMLIGLLLMFLFAYRKQTNYIAERVKEFEVHHESQSNK